MVVAGAGWAVATAYAPLNVGVAEYVGVGAGAVYVGAGADTGAVYVDVGAGAVYVWGVGPPSFNISKPRFNIFVATFARTSLFSAPNTTAIK